MWRAFFFAVGVFAVILGGQFLAVDKLVMTKQERAATRLLGMNMPGSMSLRNKEMTPPEWAPWSLLSFGAVTMLYSFTLNRGGGH
jgi:hypothetical protein